MPTKEQVKKLENKLSAEKADLEKQLAELEKGLDFGDDVDSFEEETDETEEFSNRLDTKRVLKERLININKALSRIKAGVYGVCEKCGREIGLAVLEAAPESSLCQNCKISK